ncbi:MAG TPA: hypothetical protein VF750_05375 [Sphingomicrobium sp.]
MSETGVPAGSKVVVTGGAGAAGAVRVAVCVNVTGAEARLAVVLVAIRVLA